jgi:hypothetical protein
VRTKRKKQLTILLTKPKLFQECDCRDLDLPQNQWVKKLEMAPLQHVGFFALLKKQADMHERSQGLVKQPLACFLTPVALELVPTSALSSTEAT